TMMCSEMLMCSAPVGTAIVPDQTISAATQCSQRLERDHVLLVLAPRGGPLGHDQRVEAQHAHRLPSDGDRVGSGEAGGVITHALAPIEQVDVALPRAEREDRGGPERLQVEDPRQPRLPSTG